MKKKPIYILFSISALLLLLTPTVIGSTLTEAPYDDIYFGDLKLSNLLEICDEDTRNEVESALQAGLTLYLTVSSSKERKAFHIFFPLLLRIIKVKGLFLMGLIIHRTLSASTIVFKLSLGTPIPIKSEKGRHVIFLLGVGYTNMGRPFYSGSGELVAFSLTKPLIIL